MTLDFVRDVYLLRDEKELRNIIIIHKLLLKFKEVSEECMITSFFNASNENKMRTRRMCVCSFFDLGLTFVLCLHWFLWIYERHRTVQNRTVVISNEWINLLYELCEVKKINSQFNKSAKQNSEASNKYSRKMRSLHV